MNCTTVEVDQRQSTLLQESDTATASPSESRTVRYGAVSLGQGADKSYRCALLWFCCNVYWLRCNVVCVSPLFQEQDYCKIQLR